MEKIKLQVGIKGSIDSGRLTLIKALPNIISTTMGPLWFNANGIFRGLKQSKVGIDLKIK